MIFGRETNAPIDLEFGKALEIPSCNEAYLHWLTGTIAYTHGRAREILHTQREKQRFYHDRRLKKREFQVGDEVLYLSPVKRKLQKHWIGPYEVIKKMETRHHYVLKKGYKTR